MDTGQDKFQRGPSEKKYLLSDTDWPYQIHFILTSRNLKKKICKVPFKVWQQINQLHHLVLVSSLKPSFLYDSNFSLSPFHVILSHSSNMSLHVLYGRCYYLPVISGDHLGDSRKQKEPNVLFMGTDSSVRMIPSHERLRYFCHSLN